jgi:SlyX protein
LPYRPRYRYELGMNSAPDDMQQRLIALETRLTHHERMAEELSDVLAEQQRTIDMLTAQVRRLTGRLQEIAAGWSPSPQDDRPPPHY